MVITLLSDFGLNDSFVAQMKGVILTLNPSATLVDITHLIAPYDVMGGALMLGGSFSVFPAGTIHLAVVDPGVGSDRRPIVVVTQDYFFVGPDNGIFSCIYSQVKGDFQVYHATASEYFRKCVNGAGGSGAIGRTFHGRDIFAPLCAHLSNGLDPTRLGNRIDDFITLDMAVPTVDVGSGSVSGQVVYIDRFGNCITNIDEGILNTTFQGVSPGQVRVIFRDKELPLTGCYEEAGHLQLSALINSSGSLELFVNQASASEQFDILIGQRVMVG
ncbi:MAG: SAM-dependent chlorinase/fluorinase [Magnetococcales bacterium]|uniref:SAM-dependent chlorinase/fluorinase n=1 Tax=Candidatus Magnetobacterium casense TaxID=1455061 RepID=A0ABS6RXV1_9BACT|nr:SAM-dependent chlorinase/fluorinase [Candidatus Magnetobacterium casensis]MBF0608344.1 SAM-dependent chlorinase/fluorinase [Nitrospirota bacterium]MBV6341436.1 SAM-dependent chlorinase/fluorinase [Candidatus Magnetobacterium casensis]